MTTTKTTRLDFVEYREVAYDSGLTEIGVYVDELLRGSGPILAAVISRQPGDGSKWCVYAASASRPVLRTRVKREAIERGWEIACATTAGEIHASKRQLVG
jgi:hypothetical protein